MQGLEMSFENRLQQALSELNMSQSELARRLDTTSQSVSGWCNGILPRKDKLERLPEVLGRPLYWFFLEPNDPIVPELATPQGKQLSEQESRLIERFNRLPTSEKEHMISLFETKIAEYDRLLEELIKLKEQK
ncbi:MULTISPECIES: helix-turn-helix domain-containing protein [Yersinia]|uniref:helix-turn-helix domain-containing protein n=1 Tax=Yersinia TaxID=629 RepID=UPI001F2F3A20|nr:MULTISPECIES: helix-turn-helix domain-containing protein [Yersinia]